MLVIAPDWDQEDWAANLTRHDAHRPIHTWGADAPLAEYSYAAVWNPPIGALAAMRGLRVIFNLGAGVDHLFDDPALPQVPIVRCVNPDLTGRMTEYVVCQVLLHHRRIPAYRTLQDARSWKALPQPAAGQVTVGILGLGVLGRAA
ncbi:MAG: glyoxylate/hydroxypyruvate reductase A, partial [Hyphomicrobiales bacterium]